MEYVKERTLFQIFKVHTLKEIEKKVHKMKIDHECLNKDPRVKITVEPDPKTVCFYGTEKKFNVSLFFLG